MKELGGDHMDVLEIDLQRGPEHDMMSDELYAALLRGAWIPVSMRWWVDRIAGPGVCSDIIHYLAVVHDR